MDITCPHCQQAQSKQSLINGSCSFCYQPIVEIKSRGTTHSEAVKNKATSQSANTIHDAPLFTYKHKGVGLIMTRETAQISIQLPVYRLVIFFSLFILAIGAPWAYFSQPYMTIDCFKQISKAEWQKQWVFFAPERWYFSYTWNAPLENPQASQCRVRVRYMHPVVSLWNHEYQFSLDHLQSVSVREYEGDDSVSYEVLIYLKAPDSPPKTEEEKKLLFAPLRGATAEYLFETFAEFLAERESENLHLSYREPLYITLIVIPLWLFGGLWVYLIFMGFKNKPMSQDIWLFDKQADCLREIRINPFGKASETVYPFQMFIGLRHQTLEGNPKQGQLLVKLPEEFALYMGPFPTRQGAKEGQMAVEDMHARLIDWLQT